MSIGSANVVRRTCRRVGLDRNPMRRREDRLQSAVGAVLTLLFLIVMPVLAVVVGGRVYAIETAAVQAETAQLRQTDATVVEAGKASLYAPISSALVQWRDADGVTHLGDYQTTGLVEPGGTVRIWLDDAGKIVEPPSDTRAMSKAVVTTSGGAFAILVCFTCFYVLLGRGLDRRRLRLWEREWATTSWGGGSGVPTE